MKLMNLVVIVIVMECLNGIIDVNCNDGVDNYRDIVDKNNRIFYSF